jgi:hypothetical protein
MEAGDRVRTLVGSELMVAVSKANIAQMRAMKGSNEFGTLSHIIINVVRLPVLHFSLNFLFRRQVAERRPN